MSSVSSVQFTGLQNTNGYNTNTEKSEKSFAKTGAAIGALGGTVTSGLILSSKKGREGLATMLERLQESGKGKKGAAAIVGGVAGAITAVSALIGAVGGGFGGELAQRASNKQNTANTETITLDAEA